MYTWQLALLAWWSDTVKLVLLLNNPEVSISAHGLLDVFIEIYSS